MLLSKLFFFLVDICMRFFYKGKKMDEDEEGRMEEVRQWLFFLMDDVLFIKDKMKEKFK